MINALGLGSMKSQSPAYDQGQSSVGVEPAAPSADRYTDSQGGFYGNAQHGDGRS